jgi:glycerophosphoryl diester phosphodiesterase
MRVALAALTVAALTSCSSSEPVTPEPRAVDEPVVVAPEADWGHLPHGAVVAHRGGAMRAPENTMAAFLVAAAAPSVEALEMDVHLLADGGLGVIHDAVLPDGRPVATMTSAEFRTTGHPLLGDVLAAFGGRERLVIETKAHDAVAPLLALLGTMPVFRDSVVVQSFAPADLALAELEGYDTMALGTADVGTVDAAGSEWIAPSLDQVTPALVDAAHAAGLRVAVWTIRSPEQHTAARALGVDAIMSDIPW